MCTTTPRRGAAFWGEFFGDLKRRELERVSLIISDGLNSIEEVARQHFPGAEIQLCTVHLRRELTRKVRPRDKSAFTGELHEVFGYGGAGRAPLEWVMRFRAYADRWGGALPLPL